MAVTVDIRSESDVFTACREASVLAERLGFAGAELAHVVTAISEIATNVRRHAGRGRVELERVDEPARVGIAVTVADGGPGIADLDTAMRDGWSSVGSMGLGLPGARRLMDEFAITSEPGAGTTVTMTRWRPRATAAASGPLVDWAAAPAPVLPGREALVRPFPNGVLVAVVAGVGAGRDAELAAEMAGAILTRHASRSPIALLERCHAALRATRGASIGLASFSALDPAVTWLALGDVGVRLLRPGQPGRPPWLESAPELRGAAGRRLPTLRAAMVPVTSADTLVLDAGLQAPFEPTGEQADSPPRRLAEGLLGPGQSAGLVLVARRR